jgi:murein DD-endopeptidase MepM/ murein hydrolase activator NlpD
MPRRLLLLALLAVLTGCSPSAREPAAATATTGPPGRPATTGPPATTSSATRAAPTPARHRFPVAGCRVSYAHVHHDYPATDIMAARGCRFVSPVDGRVDEVSRVDRWDGSTDRGADRGGRSVSVVGVDGVRYYGSHLEWVAPGIAPGVPVRAGQLLGRVGNSGSARGGPTHLHFGLSWPSRPGVWWLRRGVLYPWPYLDAWRAGRNLSPARAIRAARAAAGQSVPACRVDC